MPGSNSDTLREFSWESLIEALPGIFYIFDDHGVFLAWNRAFLQVTGYTEKDMETLHPLDLFGREDKKQVQDRIQAVFSQGKGTVEAKLITKSGRPISFSFSGTRLDIGGKNLLCGMGVDVSESKHIEDQLLFMNQEFILQASALNATVNAVFITNEEGHILWVNHAFERMTGYTKDEVVGKTPEILNSGVQEPPYYENLWNTILSGKHWQGELVNRKKDGTLYIEEESITPILNEVGKVTHFIAIKQDITERKNQEKKIKRLNRIYEVLSSINTMIVRVPQKDELFQEAVRIAVEYGNFDIAFIDTYDSSQDSIVFHSGNARDEKELDVFKNAHLTHVLTGHGLISAAVRTKKSAYSNDITLDNRPQSPRRQVALDFGYRSMIVLPLLVGTQVVAVMSLLSKEVDYFDQDELRLLFELSADISFALNHIQTSMEARFLSQFHPVTGLPNRKNFLEKVDTFLQKMKNLDRRGILIVFDFEKFRNINSTLGRHKGDLILQMLRERFREFPYKEYLLGHLERDHFAVFMEGDFSSSDLVHILNDIRSIGFSMPYSVDEMEIHLTGRFGIAHFPDDASEADKLLKNAEDARNRAKFTKESYAFYSSEMNAKVVREQLLENELRQALVRNEFEFFYQPKYDAFSGNLTGCESLIRWKKPDGHFVGPDVFIPIMEEIGMIHDIGILAIQNALEKYNSWQFLGLNPPRIAVNISAAQFGDPDFLKTVQSILSLQDIQTTHHGIDLELTENSIMKNIDLTVKTMEALRFLGFKIAIDDFGTGYSSLNYLARLPLDNLKIDKSFVFSMQNNPADMTIVSTIITLAHQLGLSVVAEGVETESQASLLREMKCNEFQGYLFCKPLPEQDFVRLLQENKDRSKV